MDNVVLDKTEFDMLVQYSKNAYRLAQCSAPHRVQLLLDEVPETPYMTVSVVCEGSARRHAQIIVDCVKQGDQVVSKKRYGVAQLLTEIRKHLGGD